MQLSYKKKKNSVPNGGATLLFEGYLSLHLIGQNLKSYEGVAESKVEGMLLASRYWDAGEYYNADMKYNIFLVISLNRAMPCTTLFITG